MGDQDRLRLLHGDDVWAIGVAAGSADVVLDAEVCPATEVLERSGGGLFGPVRVLVLNAQSLDTASVAQLADQPVTLRVDAKAPVALVRAVQSAGGSVESHTVPKDPAEAAAAEARRLNVTLTGPARRTVAMCCPGDVSLARSVVRACALAGISEIGPRQVERLTGGRSQDAQVREVTRAVRSGQPAAAVAALDRCRADPHALVAAIRRELAGMDELPAGCAHLVAAAEDRLRSAGREAALWVLVPQLAAAIGRDRPAATGRR